MRCAERDARARGAVINPQEYLNGPGWCLQQWYTVNARAANGDTPLLIALRGPPMPVPAFQFLLEGAPICTR